MATASLLPNGEQQFIDENGAPYAGGSVFFYIPNTLTPKNTWQDVGETILNTNPVILDAAGRAIIYGSGQYRQILKDSLGNTVWDQLTQDVYGLVMSSDNVFTGDNTFEGDTTFIGDVTFASGVNLIPTTVATGTVDIITATYSPAISLKDKTIVALISSGPNTSIAPTFAPNGLLAHTITSRGGRALLAGDTGQAGFVMLLEYNLANTRWELMNPVAAGSLLTNFVSTPGVISSTDTVFTAIEKLNGNFGGVPRESVNGFIPSAIVSSSSTSCTLTVGTGQAADSTGAVMFASGSSFSWNIANGNAANGYSGGTTLPNSTTIHFYVIAKTTESAWSASFASNSLTPTLPGLYAGGYYRRVFSIPTNGSGVLYVPSSAGINEIEGGGICYTLATQLIDVNVSNLTTTRVLYTLTMPTGIILRPLIRAETSTGNAFILLTNPSETSVIPQDSAGGWNVAPIWDLGVAHSVSVAPYLLTNTSAQIGAQASSGTKDFSVCTRGWIDFRRI